MYGMDSLAINQTPLPPSLQLSINELGLVGGEMGGGGVLGCYMRAAYGHTLVGGSAAEELENSNVYDGHGTIIRGLFHTGGLSKLKWVIKV